MRIGEVEDNKHYVAYLSRWDSKYGDKCRITVIRLVGGYSYQKAKTLAEAFKRESPSVSHVLGDGSKELLYWTSVSGKKLKKLVGD